MVNAKDTFYIALRNRLAAVNPQRTVVARGALRPGILVEEAEPAVSKMPRDVYVLRWTGLERNVCLPQTMALLHCEIHYCTAGSEAACGLDRGRSLATMDAEISEMLKPMSTPTMNLSTNPAAATGTTTFWTEPVFGPTTSNRDSLERVVKVTVLARQVGGEQ
jgi:hypothetical protein